jgi:uncharacterized radical SAM superfamily Fe-S cluster-containing enzyme
VRAGRVVLRRSCPDHGEFAAVVYGDAERYLESQRNAGVMLTAPFASDI